VNGHSRSDWYYVLMLDGRTLCTAKYWVFWYILWRKVTSRCLVVCNLSQIGIFGGDVQNPREWALVSFFGGGGGLKENCCAWDQVRLEEYLEGRSPPHAPFGVEWNLGYCYWGQYWPIVLSPDDDECGAVGGMRIDRRNRSTRRKSAAMSLCPPQISHYLTWDRTRAAAVDRRLLTAWATARRRTFIQRLDWTGWRRIGGSCTHENEPSDFIKSLRFLYRLSRVFSL
jgi:hypothetical protein